MAVSMQKLFRQTFEGHAGRPGEVGGSVPAGRSLTGREHFAVDNYKNTGYSYINRTLREGKESEFSESVRKQVDTLDNLISENKTTEDMTLYRVIEGKRAAKQYLSEGARVQDKGFMSVSTKEGSAMRAVQDASGAGKNSTFTTLRIAVPKGTNAFDLQSNVTSNPIGYLSQGDEGEYLLGRNTVLEIVNVDIENGIVDAKISGVKQNILLFHSGGTGSGFAGHKGRIGKVGGSTSEKGSTPKTVKGSRYIGQTHHENRTADVYLIDSNAQKFFDTFSTRRIGGNNFSVAIAISGEHKGTVLASVGYGGHEEMLHIYDSSDTIDNWVRVYNENGKIEADVKFAGVFIDSEFNDPSQIRTANSNIREAKKILSDKGYSTSWKVIRNESQKINFLNWRGKLFHFGGTGSGFQGHKGRIGQVGGSTKEYSGSVPGVDHRKRVENVVKRLGFPVERVKSTEDKGYTFTVGNQVFRAGGEYNPNTGEITMYDVDERSDSELEGMLAHEIQHSRYRDLRRESQKQFVEVGRQVHNKAQKNWPIVSDGSLKPQFKDKYWAYDIDHTYLTFGSDRFKILISSDGVTEYSKSYWQKAISSKSSFDYDIAVDETLAEIARMETGNRRIGDNPIVAPVWQDLYNKVKRGKP